MTSHVVLRPSEIPSISSADAVAPLLLRLLECPVEILPTLASQVLTSLQELPQEDIPTSYEGLIDVARFCVEEEPGWTLRQRAQLIGGHPRIGRQKVAISATSAKEQGDQRTSEETYQRLDKLNYLYERRFPGLRFVTYVAGRPRSAIADELSTLLGPNVVGLPPPDAKFDPDDVASSWSGFPAADVRDDQSAEWKAELERGEGALWEIAGDRATKLAQEVESGTVTVTISAPSAEIPAPSSETESKKDTQPAQQPALTITPENATSDQGTSSFDVPFLSQATFRALILASPILHTFFEQDLPTSFLLQPVERQTSTKEAFLSALNDATGQGAGKAVTRERVRGLLGGLLGDVADAVGNRLQQQTVSGPKPSFDRAGKRGRGLSLEEAARTQGSRLAPVSPAALSQKSSTAALRKQAAEDEKRERDASEAVRLAQEALVSQRDSTQQFVIDAPGDETADGAEDVEEEEDLVMGGLTDGVGEEGKLTGKDAQLAKDLRSAEAQ